MDNKLKKVVLEQINEINSVFEKDDRRFGGYSATEYANNTAPEDYNEDRLPFNKLRGNADSMYYMLTDIKSAIEKLKEDIDVELQFGIVFAINKNVNQ